MALHFFTSFSSPDHDPDTDADGQCEFRYLPDGWGKSHWFLDPTASR
jgi:hypothetical protein